MSIRKKFLNRAVYFWNRGDRVIGTVTDVVAGDTAFLKVLQGSKVYTVPIDDAEVVDPTIHPAKDPVEPDRTKSVPVTRIPKAVPRFHTGSVVDVVCTCGQCKDKYRGVVTGLRICFLPLPENDMRFGLDAEFEYEVTFYMPLAGRHAIWCIENELVLATKEGVK